MIFKDSYITDAGIYKVIPGSTVAQSPTRQRPTPRSESNYRLSMRSGVDPKKLSRDNGLCF